MCIVKDLLGRKENTKPNNTQMSAEIIQKVNNYSICLEFWCVKFTKEHTKSFAAICTSYP